MSKPHAGTIGSVGVIYVPARISDPRRPGAQPIELEFLVDTGAIYSVVPGAVLEAIGVPRLKRREFTLADGTHQAYDVGEAFFELGADRGTSQVVFGPEGVTPLLGAFTLESLGLMVNPVTRELLPMRLVLARVAASQ
jgi:clan AA aspartic protease